VRVLVINGGDSAERNISLKSGAAVGTALTDSGYEVVYCDPLDEDVKSFLDDVDVVFPILHGGQGESGELQKILEERSLPFVGSDSKASEKCFDKLRTAELAPSINFPKTELVSYLTFKDSALIKKPFVLKPRAEGSSVDTFVVRNPEEFDSTLLNEVFDRHENEMLLQELIEGIEITVPIIGDKPFPVVEIIPPKGKEFDFENKYNGQTIENCPPKFVPLELQLRAQKIALELHQTMGCRDLSRTDMIITADNNIYCLEINTLPGMTQNSLVPLSARNAGLTMPMLVDSLVKMALARS
jgi:D-alanine-D-alanine ligase